MLRNKLGRIAALSAGVILATMVGAAWWLGVFTDPPDEVAIDPAIAGRTGDLSSGEGTFGAIEDLSGSWDLVGDQASFAGYRIDEELLTIGRNTVVARTHQMSGLVEGQRNTITAASVTIDLTTLTTDNRARDQAMRSQALETDQWPEATFELRMPIELEPLPDEGVITEVTALGDLTLHGVTRRVEVPLSVAGSSGAFVVVGQLEVELADYDITTPQAPIVASVGGTAIVELNLVFQQSR